MSHLRTFRNWLSVTLAFLIGVPWLPLSAPRAAMAASAPAARSFNTTIAQTSTVDFKPALDLLVSRSLNSLGWQVNSIQSQLNSPAPAEGATRQSGQGNWTIQAQDEQSQTLTLNGSLDFQISGQSQPDYSLDGAVTISGTLSGSNVSVLLTTDQSNHVTLDQLGNATTNIIVTLTRDGQTSTTHLKATTASKAIAYNLDQATTQVTVDRAGQVYTWNQTVTARDFGKGESEIWLHATFTGGTSTAGDTTIDQHSFQHVDSNGVSVDYERYDIQVGDNHYHLKAPAQARTTLDGQIASDLVLVDQQGNPIGQIGGQISEVGGHGLLSPALGRAMLASLTAVEPASSLRTCADAAGFLASVGWSFLFGLAFAIALGNPITGAAAMWILIGATASAGIGLAAAQGEANAKTQDEKDAIAEKAFIMQFVMAAMTGGGASGTAGGAGRGVLGKAVSYLPGQAVNQAARNVASGSSCNADPFFLYPDIRPGGGTGSTPLQVLRVSGGLISTTTTLASSSEVTASIPASLGHFEQYSDRPELFVGSAVPAGATTIGAWQWDTAHTFGAGVSHTQSPVDGSQKHYFIHASQPLSVTADDNLIQYVYLDPQHPPKEIYLQFYTGDGNGEHRAYWGVDEAQTGGAAGSTALFPMGSLPPTGAWARLKVPVDQIDLSGQFINGVLYGTYDGQTWWGPTTTSSRLTDDAPDQLLVQGPHALPAMLPGAEITYRLANPTRVTLEVVDAQGQLIRTLLKDQNQTGGYQAIVWDGKNDQGAAAPDNTYRYRFSLDGNDVADGTISLSPLVADIRVPTHDGLVRGNTVPVIGEAYGSTFSNYVLDYGQGLTPTKWITITASQSPVVLPPAKPFVSGINVGNLANWDTGLDEFQPWHEAGLSGVYTLRLRVMGKDGRMVSDSVPVIVGRLAHSAEGGTIASPDGKARLIIPPLATQNAFSLMALIPSAQIDPGEGWRANLPAGDQLAGDVYEIFPADEDFREPATLELPYQAGSPTDKLGVLIGDGTPTGWRYLGGTVDATKQVIRVNVNSFGGKRALAAAFTSNQFGTPQPFRTPAAPLTFDTSQAAPIVSSKTAPVAFYDDFESTPDEWAAIDQFGTQLTRVQASEAGLTNTTGSVLKVTRLADGVRMVQVHATPYDAAKYPLISFDYRAPADYAPNLLVKSNGYWWQIRMGNAGVATSHYYDTLQVPELQTDDAWHHYQVDVLALLRAAQPGVKDFQIDELVLGQVNLKVYAQVEVVDGGGVGSAYYIDNFAALAPISTTQIALNWSAPAHTSDSAYSFSFDQKNDSQPPQSAKSTSDSATVSLPKGAAAGLWYFHVRGQSTNGQWSTAAHYPILIDRQPPSTGQPLPAPNGAGAPNYIEVPMSDATSGIDLAKAQLQINGKTFGAGPGLIYDPLSNALQVTPYELKPALQPIPNGQKVSLSLTIQDYAGNVITTPLTWSFTADQPKVASDQFRALTKDGGESPALSPDGSQVAFVSNRSGQPQIWIMRADDYGEQAQSAHLLINGSSHESDPAWSPDGASLAFISNASGSPQIWTAAADGSNPHQVTLLSGALASPTWSPDGQTLAFVKDGNLWQVNLDGSGLHALSSYPDQPMQAVKWQPGGNLLAVDFKLYQETIELFNPATNDLQPLTNGGQERDPAWLNSQTILYTAPAGPNQPDAVWRINLDGSDQRIIDGSGQPGVADVQPSPAADGSSLALVSTRSGARNIWVQATLQIARFDASPSTGVVPGDQMQITYALPADSDVTLQVLDDNNKVLRTLLDRVHQSKGVQTATWDGMGTDGKPVPAGDYTLKVTAAIGSGEPIERFTTGRVLDAANIGSLQLQIDQWANQLVAGGDLHVKLYPAGFRILPVAKADFDPSPTFKLPSGQYDASVTLGDVQRDFHNIIVQAGQTVTTPLNLQLGGLQITVLSAPGQPASDNAFVSVSRSNASGGTPVAQDFGGVSNFVLQPGQYDVQADYQGVKQAAYGLEVKAGQITQQTINLGSGTLHLDVSAHAGQPADGNRLTVYAYRPNDHTNQIGSALYENPSDLHLPAGTYDFQLKYLAGLPAGSTGGEIAQWLTGVAIQSGQTITQAYNLHLGQAKIDVFEAAGKPAEADRLTFYIYQRGDRSTQIASGLFIDSATFELLPGQYDIVANYAGSSFDRVESTPLSVQEGQTTDQAVNLKAGRIQIEVDDASGQLTDPSKLTVYAYPAGTRDAVFASDVYQNPTVLIVQADTAYDIVIHMDNQQLILSGQSVKEGDLLNLRVNAADFK